MAGKFIDFLIWTLIIALALGVLALLVQPIIWWTPYSEARLYVRVFLLMFAVNTFATLRLYNSIVQNTRFSIKLRESFNRLMTIIPGVERSLKTLGNSLMVTKTSVDSLKKEISSNTDEVDSLIEKINKLNASKR